MSLREDFEEFIEVFEGGDKDILSEVRDLEFGDNLGEGSGEKELERL